MTFWQSWASMNTTAAANRATLTQTSLASFGDLPSAEREPCGDEGGDGGVLVGNNYGHKEEDAYPKAKEEAAEV
jgi:hypothetical protein